ncbi:hypothetical protein D3C86_1429500 [compost metagenome]
MAIKGKIAPHGARPKFSHMTGRSQKVETVTGMVRATVAAQPARAIRRARVLSAPSVLSTR